MREFYKSKAGKQLLALMALGAVLWTAGFVLRFNENLFQYMAEWEDYGIENLLLAINIGGAISFIYSVMRILDLRKEMERQARAQAHADWTSTHDQLTKLPNRYAFERKVLPRIAAEDDEELAEHARNITVFSIDLNDFKKVNDLVGHKGGDMLLVEVSRRLCALGHADCVYRFGGDEFIIIARGLSESREAWLATVAIQALTRPIQIGNVAVEVGASIGYSRWNEETETLEDAAHRADLAMYEAKSRGSNRFLAFDVSMQDKVAERARLESRLRIAIQENAIKPYYQPLIDLKTREICGFEALARWKDDQGAFIPPPVFIEIAEETGLITELFEKLLRQACNDARAWPETIMLSFNVSPVQIEDKLLASRILRVLNDAGLAAKRLEVEITENAIIQDPVVAQIMLDELHRAGVQIALDDFGTGYSSLAQLSRYRFDKIKIDKSFIDTYRDDERQEKIVRAMLGLGRSLNIKTTAEGIEEQSQLAYLTQLGCDIGQGYIFGKAMPADAAEAFIRQSRESLATAG